MVINHLLTGMILQVYTLYSGYLMGPISPFKGLLGWVMVKQLDNVQKNSQFLSGFRLGCHFAEKTQRIHVLMVEFGGFLG